MKTVFLYSVLCKEFGTGRTKTVYINSSDIINEDTTPETISKFVDRVRRMIDFDLDYVSVSVLGKQNSLIQGE